jgi:hypothetical protein
MTKRFMTSVPIEPVKTTSTSCFRIEDEPRLVSVNPVFDNIPVFSVGGADPCCREGLSKSLPTSCSPAEEIVLLVLVDPSVLWFS